MNSTDLIIDRYTSSSGVGTTYCTTVVHTLTGMTASGQSKFGFLQSDDEALRSLSSLVFAWNHRMSQDAQG